MADVWNLKIWFWDSFRTFIPLRFQSISHIYDKNYAMRTSTFSSSEQWKNETLQLMNEASVGGCKDYLDFGCNTGDLYYVLKKFNNKAKYNGVDINRDAIQIAHQKSLKCQHFDGRNVPFPSNSMDCVLMSHCIGHIENPQQAFAEIRRLLRNNGKLLIVTPNKGFKRSKIIKNLFKKYQPDQTVLRYYSKNSLELFLQNNGFKVDKVWLSGEYGFEIFKFSLETTRSRLFAVATKNINK